MTFFPVFSVKLDPHALSPAAHPRVAGAGPLMGRLRAALERLT